MIMTQQIMPVSALKDLWSKKKKNKYNAVKVKRGEKTFHSKLEARMYDLLKYQKDAGTVKFFLMQVPIQLPGNTKYVVDFLIFYENGDIEFLETKGKMTPMANLKIKQAEALYPIKIRVVTNKDLQ